MTPGFSVSMLGWGYNEEENLPAYVERAEAFLHAWATDFELIIVDDGSTDGMWQVAQQLQVTRPWLRLLRNDRNMGVAYSAKRAFAAATKEYLFWQTVDWAYDIEQLGPSFRLLRDFTALQGVRANALTLEKSFGRRSDTLFKGLVSYTNYHVIRVLFRLPLSDYQNVTVYPTALVHSMVLEADSSFTNAELLLKAWWKGASFKEVPVPFIKRQRGVAKGTRLTNILKSVRDILYWWCRWVLLGRRPDHKRGRVERISGTD